MSDKKKPGASSQPKASAKTDKKAAGPDRKNTHQKPKGK